MSHSHDEFGAPSLEEMFSDLPEPEYADLTGFGPGSTFAQVTTSTDTHLCVMFDEYTCSRCHKVTLAPNQYAVRKLHHTRNQCIEYQAVPADMLHLFDHLPKLRYYYHHHSTFCIHCIDSEEWPREE